MHRGHAAVRTLSDAAHNGSTAERREDAIFWLSQNGSADSEQAILRAIVSDPLASVREHAVFALSQLPGERGVDMLFGVLNDRDRPLALRERALCWPVQSESDRACDHLDRLFANGR